PGIEIVDDVGCDDAIVVSSGDHGTGSGSPDVLSVADAIAAECARRMRAAAPGEYSLPRHRTFGARAGLPRAGTCAPRLPSGGGPAVVTASGRAEARKSCAVGTRRIGERAQAVERSLHVCDLSLIGGRHQRPLLFNGRSLKKRSTAGQCRASLSSLAC